MSIRQAILGCVSGPGESVVDEPRLRALVAQSGQDAVVEELYEMLKHFAHVVHACTRVLGLIDLNMTAEAIVRNSGCYGEYRKFVKV